MPPILTAAPRRPPHRRRPRPRPRSRRRWHPVRAGGRDPAASRRADPPGAGRARIRRSAKSPRLLGSAIFRRQCGSRAGSSFGICQEAANRRLVGKRSLSGRKVGAVAPGWRARRKIYRRAPEKLDRQLATSIAYQPRDASRLSTESGEGARPLSKDQWHKARGITLLPRAAAQTSRGAASSAPVSSGSAIVSSPMSDFAATLPTAGAVVPNGDGRASARAVGPVRRIKIRSGAVILGTAIVLSPALASCSAKDCAYYGSPDANTRCVVISAPTTGGGQ